MNPVSGKWLVGLMAVALASSAYAQTGKQIIKSGSRALSSNAAEMSILKTMDNWYGIGAALKKSPAAASIERAVKQQLPVKETREHAFRNSGFFDPIMATPIRELQINLIHPTTEQVQQAVNEYRSLMRDLAPVRKEVNAKLLYQSLPNDKWVSFPPQERRRLISELAALQGRVEKLRRVVFSKDAALEKVGKWIDEALKQINPYYVPAQRTSARADSRSFNREEFFLKYPDVSKVPQGVTAPKRELPANIRVAVLNDQTDVLDMYRIWDAQKRLGEGWSVTTYKDTRDLINAIQSGNVYDLIITDLTVPGGGGYYLVDEVRSMGLNMPIIGCSMYTIDKLNAEKMFEQGFDGYIYGDDMFEEIAGSVSWVGYIKNYYYYKALHGWSR